MKPYLGDWLPLLLPLSSRVPRVAGTHPSCSSLTLRVFLSLSSHCSCWPLFLIVLIHPLLLLASPYRLHIFCTHSLSCPLVCLFHVLLLRLLTSFFTVKTRIDMHTLSHSLIRALHNKQTQRYEWTQATPCIWSLTCATSAAPSCLSLVCSVAVAF